MSVCVLEVARWSVASDGSNFDLLSGLQCSPLGQLVTSLTIRFSFCSGPDLSVGRSCRGCCPRRARRSLGGQPGAGVDLTAVPA